MSPEEKKMSALIGLVMMGVAGGVMSAEEGQVTRLEYCTQWAGLAQDYMTARQLEVPLSRIIADNDDFAELAMDAYSVPVYEGEGAQQSAVDEFYTKHFIKCMKGE
jgi:hypothetical protein